MNNVYMIEFFDKNCKPYVSAYMYFDKEAAIKWGHEMSKSLDAIAFNVIEYVALKWGYVIGENVFYSGILR